MNRKNLINATLTAAIVLGLALLIVPSLVAAQGGGPSEYYAMNVGGASITWVPLGGNAGPLTLTVTGPDGFYFRKNFNGRAAISSRGLADGVYNYEIVPSSGGGDGAPDEANRGLGAVAQARIQSGAFTVLGGAFVSGGSEAVADVVNPDDVIVQGSLCVGFDCVNNENFGFDTIRLKENNLRIKFEDTSVSAGFPTNDWQITANDSASGGASFLAFDDITGSKTPFKVTAGAPTNSLFVSSSGDVGVKTSTPVLDFHANTSDTPGIRLEQNGSGGFTPQTWDIGANEANFFVRDVTGGSRLSLRIRPGAPTSSIDIAASGNVGFGTASPDTSVDVERTGSNPTMAVNRTDGANLQLGSGPASSSVGTINNFPILFFTNSVTRMTLATNGNLTVTGSVTATAFNPSSDRHIKENFGKVNRSSVLDRLARIPISTWNFIGENGTVHMGPMAQDFYAAFGLGTDDKHISTVDADGVAFAAIQELNLRNEALASENASLRGQVKDLAARVTSLEAGGVPAAPILIWALVASNLALIVWVVLSTRRAVAVKSATRK
ncbi:MAG: tail fiber domain-containing protein [Chloroflexi bacterium]|nr:tail fiber domain-containing protein [Chloroflexota bacterium]